MIVTAKRLFGLFWLSVITGGTAAATLEPVVAILQTTNASTRIQHRGTGIGVEARPGAELLAGDVLSSGDGAVQVVVCEGTSARLVTLRGQEAHSIRLGFWTGASMEELDLSLPCAMPSDDRQGPSDVIDDRVRGLAGLDWRQALEAIPEGVRNRLRSAGGRTGSPSAGLAARLVVITELDALGRYAEEILECSALARQYPDAAWAKRRINRLMAKTLPGANPVEPVPAPPPNAVPATGVPVRPLKGKVYALAVGISDYGRPGSIELKFAQADASAFAGLVRSGRLGRYGKVIQVPDGRRPATVAGIEQALEELVRGNAGPENTLILYLAAHGYYGCFDEVKQEPFQGPCDSNQQQPFLLTVNTSLEAGRMTGLPIQFFAQVLSDNSFRFGRVLLYIDICHAGMIDHLGIRRAPSAKVTAEILEPKRGAYGLLWASRLDEANRLAELAYEADQLKHGVFTYYLLAGLAGDSVRRGPVVMFDDLKEYVRANVKTATGQRQTPDGTENTPLSVADDLDRPYPFQPVEFTPPLKGLTTGKTARSVVAPTWDSPMPVTAPAGGPPADSIRRAELLDRGQAVLLRYIQGDQVPQRKDDFAAGARFFEEALALAPESVSTEARMLFCQGRALVFDGAYAEAERLLERSIRLDPAHGYSYNALGIALLEQVPRRPELLSRAITAFEDAHALEPLWAYPLHNLALALAQDGRFQQAVATYHDAMKIAPAYSYLPYNLGLLHLSLGQQADAERALRLALARAERRGERAGSAKRWSETAPPLNALGALYLSEGRARLAERYFRRALEHDAGHVPAMHNLGLYYSRKRDLQTAIGWFRKALVVDSGYAAARLSLAETLARTDHWTDAIAEYRQLLKNRENYAAAHRDLALLLVRHKDYADALTEMQAVAAMKPAPPGAVAEFEDIQRLQRGETPITARIRRAATGGRP